MTSVPSRRIDRLAERDQEVRILRHLALDRVERLGLDEDHRVVVADGRLQQALGVGGRRGPHHLEPGHVVEVRLHRLRVLGGELGGRPARARGSRAGYCTGRPTCSSIFAAELTIWSRARIEKLNVIISTTGRSPSIAAPDAHAGEARLADRRVDDALVAELLEQPLGHLVGAVVEPDLLAHHEDARVARASPRGGPG